MLYSSQATNHTQAQLKKLDALYNKFLRKMVNKGFKNTVVDEDGNYRPQMTNQVLHKFTETEPVKNFVEKQFLKYQGHLTRLPNSKLQKKLQSAGNSDKTWRKISNLLGGVSESQARKILHNKLELNKAIHQQFG